MPIYRHGAAPPATPLEGKVTQRQIADIVGVSQVVVSHALHQPHRARVNEATRQEILRVAQELGYQARNLTTHTIALVVWEHILPVLENVAAQIAQASGMLRARGYHLSLVLITTSDLENPRLLLDRKSVDGVVFTEWHDGIVPRLVAPGVPWVLMSNEELEEEVDCVSFDALETARRVARFLCDQGHEHIGLLTGEPQITMHQQMEQGVTEILRERGLSRANLKVSCASRTEELAERSLSWLQAPNPPTAIIARSPGAAMLTLNRLQAAGVRVPEDVSLLSFVDSMRLATLQPSITATTAMGDHVMATALDRLIEKIKTPGTPSEKIQLPGDIVVRTSVSAPRRAIEPVHRRIRKIEHGKG